MIVERPVAAHVLTIQPFVLDEKYLKLMVSTFGGVPNWILLRFAS